MMTSDWTSAECRLGDAGHGAGGTMPLRDRDRGYGAAVSMAYRQPLTDLPDDMMRLLARLN